MKSIVFILPYFGKFNNYFPLWLKSCEYNPTINWVIFTDDKTPYNYPDNVKVVYTSFDETKELIQSKFDFDIVLNFPYQICEFRVAFSKIYNEFVKDYDFWGFCDTDVIWGNIRNNITDSILSEYSKISWRGHLTLFKNTPYVNELYTSEINGVPYYRYAFSNQSDFPMAFDEGVINSIFKEKKEPVYTGLIFADLKIRSFNFYLLHFSARDEYKNAYQVFVWYKGDLQRVYCRDNKIYREDFCYVHFLKRQMSMDLDIDLDKPVLIIPNRFLNFSGELTPEFIKSVSKHKFYWSYVLQRLNIKYLKQKIRYFSNKRKYQKMYNHLPSKGIRVCLEN